MDEAGKKGTAPAAYRRWTLFLASGTLLLIALAAYLHFHGPDNSLSSTAPAGRSDSASGTSQSEKREDRPIDVQVAKPIRRDLVYTITLPANIAPFYQTTLYAKVS
ncbi:MAG: hypothetical protein AB7V39_25625, partial [Nitrospiraceae bacterium]